MYNKKIVSAIIPALNEAGSIGRVVAELFLLRDDHGRPIFDHIIVCDNGSKDGTGEIAKAAGAIVIIEQKSGYGAACLSALSAMPNSDIVVFTDGDYSFHAQQSLDLLYEIDRGADVVIGSRALGNILPGALTIPQRFGNRLATLLIRLIWKKPITDLGPYRAITASALSLIDMKNTAFGWTVEMQVKAIQHKLHMKEIAVDTRPRIGQSKISGTVSGVIGAAMGIFGTIFKLWIQQHLSENQPRQKERSL